VSDPDESEFVHTHTRSGGQDTSYGAARKAFQSGAHVKALIVGQLRLGPRPDEALEDALAPIADSTVCARRADLVREGKVTKARGDDGKVVKARNRRGNPCIVWRLVEEGEVLAEPPAPTTPDPEPEPVATTAPETPDEVIQAARSLAHWANAQKHAGLIVVAPDWDIVDAVTAHILGEP